MAGLIPPVDLRRRRIGRSPYLNLAGFFYSTDAPNNPEKPRDIVLQRLLLQQDRMQLSESVDGRWNRGERYRSQKISVQRLVGALVRI
jgi:hypothetical protein